MPISVLYAEYKWAALLIVIVGSYAWGRHDGARLEVAAMARENIATERAIDAARRGAAEEIAKLEIKNVTVQQKIERQTREVPVYRDCRHSADGLQQLNAALENGAVPPGDRQLPANAGDGSR